jgi:hypothetical protein
MASLVHLSATGIMLAAAASLVPLASSSFARDTRALQLFPGGMNGAPHSQSRVQYPSYSTGMGSENSTTCIGGYRWIQRNTRPDRSPAQSSIPIRCR